MRNILRRKSFYFGFLTGFAAFVLLTHYVDRLNRPICFDCGEKFGIPFHYLETGGQAFSSRYIWEGLILNLICTLLVGVLTGLVIQSICMSFWAHKDK